jgi:hypothetical protein
MRTRDPHLGNVLANIDDAKVTASPPAIDNKWSIDGRSDGTLRTGEEIQDAACT